MTSGIRERKGIAGWIGWLMPLLGVTDWLDGSLARRAGPTRLGSVLDIEADSWLTLWSATGTVAGVSDQGGVFSRPLCIIWNLRLP